VAIIGVRVSSIAAVIVAARAPNADATVRKTSSSSRRK